MKIVYFAQHGNTKNSNDEEGAITHALKELGHEVECIPQSDGAALLKSSGDLLLLHKIGNGHNRDRIRERFRCVAFWYFDLFEYDDPQLAIRNSQRLLWYDQNKDLFDIGFCTDGDFAKKDLTGRLFHLSQAADARKMDRAFQGERNQIDLLFTGTVKGGTGRKKFVGHMFQKYGRQRFRCIEARLYGNELAQTIAGSKIVVAPMEPVTDLYWSNRVYLTLGFGGFLLHPYSKGLSEHYADSKEIVFYRGLEDLDEKIDRFLKEPDFRDWAAHNAFKRTQIEHTYHHRVKRMLEIIEAEKGVG